MPKEWRQTMDRDTSFKNPPMSSKAIAKIKRRMATCKKPCVCRTCSHTTHDGVHDSGMGGCPGCSECHGPIRECEAGGVL